MTNTKLVVGGDVMLGRLVKDQIQALGIDYPMNAIAPILQRGDLTLINLECAITDHPNIWSGAPKAFYFGAPSQAIQILEKLHVNLVSLANNHALDLDYQGLIDTLNYLDQYNIHHAGAGKDIQGALKPAVLERGGIKFGLAAFCDHQGDFLATKNKPGTAYLDLTYQQQALKQFQTSLECLQRSGVEWPILSLHWGPNMVERPSDYFIEIAHAAIDMGYRMLFGHSAHVFHGIEIYKECPIIYAAGDFVNDYTVDLYFRNDHQLIVELELKNKKLNRIFLYPIFIDYCRVQPAVNEQFVFIGERMTRLCGEMGTKVEPYDETRLVIKTC